MIGGEDPAAGIPDVAKAAVRARDRVLEEVCKV